MVSCRIEYYYGDVDYFKLENIIGPPNEDGEMAMIRPSLYYSLSKMPNEKE